MGRKDRYLVGLDVGTSKVCAIVGEIVDDNGLDVVGIGVAESRGIKFPIALDAEGNVRTVAGSGPDHYDPSEPGGYDGDGGPATEAKLKQPTDVTVAESGNLYIADTHNSCVRKVDGEGIITTVAGQCGKRGSDGNGGPADEALLNRPYGVALDEEGNLYIADTHNHVIRVVYGVEQ